MKVSIEWIPDKLTQPIYLGGVNINPSLLSIWVYKNENVVYRLFLPNFILIKQFKLF